MESLKHTKGNWRSNRTNVFVECQNPAGLKHIATTLEYRGMNDCRTHIVTLEEAESNAKLICAAPDMLNALLSFIRDFETDYVLDGEIVDNPIPVLKVNYNVFKKAVEKTINGNVPDFCKSWPAGEIE